MGRSKAKSKRKRRSLTVDELAERLDSQYRLLADLCEQYDSGKFDFSSHIALQSYKILCEGKFAVQFRGKLKFPTSVRKLSKTNLADENILISALVSDNEVRFMPKISHDSFEYSCLKFTEWWNEKVFRASVAKPGSPPGVLPLDSKDYLPFERRKTMTRREIIHGVRDTLGAHLDEEIDIDLEHLAKASSFGMGFIGSNNQEVIARNTPLDAAIRQIAGEILRARDDSAIPQRVSI